MGTGTTTMGNPVYLHYDGGRYTVPGRTLEDIQGEISAALAAGEPYWMEVNYGEGRPSAARLLITPGVTLALQQDNPAEQGGPA